MLQLADCGLEDLKALQACNRLREGTHDGTHILEMCVPGPIEL